MRGDVPLDGVRGAIERAIPVNVTGSRKMNVLALHDVDVSWRLARHPVVLRAERDGLVLEIAILGEVGLQGEGVRCHANDAGVVFRVATSPTLRPGGELALDHLQWKPELRGTLQCGLFPVPVGALGDAIVEPLAGALAKGVEQIRIPMGPALEAALAALRTPRTLKLGEKEGEACLDLDPTQFVLSPVGGAVGEMTLKIGVDVAPRVTLDRCPATSASGSTHEAALVRVQPLRDEFDVALAVAVPYAEIEALVAPQLESGITSARGATPSRSTVSRRAMRPATCSRACPSAACSPECFTSGARRSLRRKGAARSSACPISTWRWRANPSSPGSCSWCCSSRTAGSKR